jgi:hypothetical protein
MHIFELRFHDKLNVAILKRTYIGPDDFAALNEAKKLSATHAIEVWDGHRRVARVKKGSLSTAPMDLLVG